jgi:RNA polymerase sigma factor (sigma-70 family)
VTGNPRDTRNPLQRQAIDLQRHSAVHGVPEKRTPALARFPSVYAFYSMRTLLESGILGRRRFPYHLFDEEYIRALQNRDPETENHLVAYFSRTIQLKLRSRLRYQDQDLADDVLQETFRRIFAYFRSGKGLKNPAGLPAFVHKVCDNVMYEMLRFHRRHEQFEENAPEPFDPGPDPEDQLVTSERKETVRKLLEQLPEKYRELLRRLLAGEDRDAVSKDLHVDRPALRVLLHRALQRYKALELQSQSGAPTS